MHIHLVKQQSSAWRDCGALCPGLHALMHAKYSQQQARVHLFSRAQIITSRKWVRCASQNVQKKQTQNRAHVEIGGSSTEKMRERPFTTIYSYVQLNSCGSQRRWSPQHLCLREVTLEQPLSLCFFFRVNPNLSLSTLPSVLEEVR